MDFCLRRFVVSTLQEVYNIPTINGIYKNETVSLKLFPEICSNLLPIVQELSELLENRVLPIGIALCTWIPCSHELFRRESFEKILETKKNTYRVGKFSFCDIFATYLSVVTKQLVIIFYPS